MPRTLVLMRRKYNGAGAAAFTFHHLYAGEAEQTMNDTMNITEKPAMQPAVAQRRCYQEASPGRKQMLEKA